MDNETMPAERGDIIGWQLADGEGHNIQGDPPDYDRYASYDVLSIEVAAEWAEELSSEYPARKFQLQAIYENDIEEPNFIGWEADEDEGLMEED